MIRKCEVLTKKHISIEKCNKAAYRNYNCLLFLRSYKNCEVVTCKYTFLHRVEVHLQSRPWMSEQTFVLVRSLHSAVYRN
jgi:hypothetical protein